MKEYRKENNSLSSVDTIIKYYSSVAAMNADIANISEKSIVSALTNYSPTLYIKRNNVMNSLTPNDEQECIGDIIAYYGSTNPDPDHYLICDGSPFSSSDWPALYNFIGSATTPNLMGYGVKGWGENSGFSSHDEISINTNVSNSMPIHSHSYTNPGHSHSATNCTHSHLVPTGFANQYVCVYSGTSDKVLCCVNCCVPGTYSTLVASICAACPELSITGTTNNATTTARIGTEVKQKTKTVLFLIKGA